jgi:hypothetical protein
MVAQLVATNTPGNFRLLTDDGQYLPVMPGGPIGGGGGDATFVLRPPGPVNAPNVFTTWGALMAAYGALQGPKWIQIDNRGIAAHVTVGAWDLGPDPVYISSSTSTEFSVSGDILVIDPGATLAWRDMIVENVTITNQNTAETVTPQALPFTLTMRTGAFIFGNVPGVKPFIDVQNSASVVYIMEAAGLGDGTHNAVTVDAGQTFYLIGTDGGTLFNHAVAGLGTFTSFISDDFAVLTPQDVATYNQNLNSVANLVAYSPGNPANWNPDPANVSDALDALAVPNAVTAPVASGSGLASSTTTTAALTKARSGKVVVMGCLSILPSATGAITLEILRDAAVIQTLQLSDTGGVRESLAINVLDTLPDANPHTYSMFVTVSAGTLTVFAGQGSIVAFEK